MSVCDDVNFAFTGTANTDLSEYYSACNRYLKIYSGEPDWRSVKKTGLYHGGNRLISMLNSAKVLCDRLAVLTFAEVPSINFSNDLCGGFVNYVLNNNDLFGRMSEILSYAYASGGCVFRPYVYDGKIGIDCVFGDNFVPTAWDCTGIKEGCFKTTSFRNGYYYTLFELHSSENNAPMINHRLFKSKTSSAIGKECELADYYPLLSETIKYDGVSKLPMFSYFRLAWANNRFSDIPLGISAFANATDTLKALDVAFDSFSREFVLGRKRIIVPSSCVQTVVDITTGEQRQYFDADDEAYVALKCDEERDLKITDNTVELRVDEHIKAINALLNILCFQVGLSAGTFSFNANNGVKTATEIISRDRRTAETIRANQNNLAKTFSSLFYSIIQMGVYLGELPKEAADDCSVCVAWHDGIITDENTLIDNSIRLVNSGLKSHVSAIMDVLKCDYDTAIKEYQRILEESSN